MFNLFLKLVVMFLIIRYLNDLPYPGLEKLRVIVSMTRNAEVVFWFSEDFVLASVPLQLGKTWSVY